LRAQALAAGWRYDAVGNLACPKCAQDGRMRWTSRRPPRARIYRSP